MIDEKLKEILVHVVSSADYTNGIAQIKQAFKDEGYRKRSWRGDWGLEEQIKNLHGWETGQEWYERFEKIVNEWPAYKPINPVRKTMLDIAKKASGLL